MYPIQTRAVVYSNKDKKPGQQQPKPATISTDKPGDKEKPVFKPDPHVRY